MITENTILSIHEKIIKNDLIGAVKLLEKVSKGEHDFELINLQARIMDLKKNEINKLDHKETLDIERGKIRNSILELLSIITPAAPVKEIRKEQANEIVLIKKLIGIIEITFNTWTAQSKLRDNLVESLENRIEDLSYHNKYDLLANYYEQLTKRELRLHKAIRGYTQNIILPNNLKIIKLLKKNPFLKKAIPKLNYLEQHLLLWESKYNSLFIDDESICLIYVGIEEKMQFPPNLLNELKKYVEDNKNPDASF